MTALNKQALRERYSPQPVPKCHICGSVMTIARASAGAVVYACSGCTYDDNGAHYAPGRSLGDEHYSASRVTIFESGDSDVLALLDELEAAEKHNDELAIYSKTTLEFREAALNENRHLKLELEIAEKRIAELEANKGKPVMFIDGDISSADAEKLAAVIREFNEETETPAARMARIIRENPHPTNMCDMPVAAAGKGEAS
ncbi:ead/Ea22-like family protein [Enterobacter hormaechei]|uniref:ead/Ea22-like family protein n=1 Tax=Enterobacter hormaechei TaxID=158836 RepID=UPI00201FB8E4|nr:ead/Ea22-like family protein [Enterobacter hormaechei]MCL8097011.1 ead/Ea22-like family protein [Enterobacter hormaechei]MCM8028797.1 ead/Ea22-like family protein [Enterobacter hormaechei]MCM8048042.1 ead/Ea22-like family protein [Enterobacter hormaechei]